MGLAPIRLGERDQAREQGSGEPGGGQPHPYSRNVLVWATPPGRKTPFSEEITLLLMHFITKAQTMI